ncbi:MAG: dynamin family protein [Deltaproteobacteria bacterium]|nr:dynamin family protein [Deltaproteobacteria bacterium]
MIIVVDMAMEQRVKKNGQINQTSDAADASGLLGILDRVFNVFEKLGEGFWGKQKRLKELRERLVEERFHLAVLGQFKRGKSTLLNAFLGEPFLPTSVVPLTSIPTLLYGGSKRCVRISFQDGRSSEFSDLSSEQASEILSNYATEERNPANKLGVAKVEVEHPSSSLSRGVVMIDTPGIGSTLLHNTEATLNFLPHCDAALFVVSADPPITEVEVEFLKAVRGKVIRLFFVMNKIDYLTEAEKNSAVGYLRKVVREQAGFNGQEPIFCVSARAALQAKLKGTPALWQESGMAQLQASLLDFLAAEKTRTLQLALARKALDVLADAVMRIRLQCHSLRLPLDDLEKRIQIFDAKVREVERERIIVGDLLTGDRKRVTGFLEKQAEELRQKARNHLQEIVTNALEITEEVKAIERSAHDRLAEEIPVFFEGELRSFSNAVELRIQETLRSYQDRADDLIEIVRRSAAELFDVSYHAPDSSGAFARTYEPYWVTHNWDAFIGSIPEGLKDRFLPAGIRQRQIRNRLSKDIEALVVHNVENIRWATLQNLDQSFRRFASELDERLKDTMEATRGAIESAYLRRQQRAETVEPEIDRLKALEGQLDGAERMLVKFVASINKEAISQ